MTSKYLSPITVKEDTDPWEGAIAINTQIPGDPFLEVYTGGSWVQVNDSNPYLRMARFDDFYTAMVNTDWLTGGRIFPGDDESYYLTTDNYESYLPSISSEDPMIKISGFSNSQEDIDEFNNLFTRLLKVKHMEGKEIDLGTGFHRHLISTRDLVDKSTTIELSSYPTEYSNILNLKETLLGRKYPCGFRLEILYIKSGTKYTGTLMFDLPVDEEKKGIIYQSSIGEDVVVEIKDECVRLFPSAPEVTECIISHCFLIYEKLL